MGMTMKLLSESFVLAVVLSATGQGFAQSPGPAVSDVEVTSVTDTSATFTFSSGVPLLPGWTISLQTPETGIRSTRLTR